jgi:hypothetical protein
MMGYSPAFIGIGLARNDSGQPSPPFAQHRTSSRIRGVEEGNPLYRSTSRS